MAVQSQHVIKSEHLAATETQKITTGTTKKLTDCIVSRLYLAGIVPIDNFRQPRRRQILLKQRLGLAGHRQGL
jgi:hypothetical protein